MPFFKKSQTGVEVRLSRSYELLGQKNLMIFTPDLNGHGSAFSVFPMKSFQNSKVFIEKTDTSYCVKSSFQIEPLVQLQTIEDAEEVLEMILAIVAPTSFQKFRSVGKTVGIFFVIWIILNIPFNGANDSPSNKYGSSPNSQLVIPKTGFDGLTISTPAQAAQPVSSGTDVSDPFGLKVVPADPN